MFSALLEYALVNYASRSDAQRLAKKKQQKQWELDRFAFEPEHMGLDDRHPSQQQPGQGDINNGAGGFPMVKAWIGYDSCIIVVLLREDFFSIGTKI